MEKLNEAIEFYEMSGTDAQILLWLLELRRHRENNWQQRAEAAEAKLAELVPPGWMVLPIEPTKEMKLASRRYVAKTKLTSGPGFYRAMVAAAPTPHE